MKKILILKAKDKIQLINKLNEYSKNAEYSDATYSNVSISIIDGIQVIVNGIDILSYDLVYLRSWKNFPYIATSIARFLQSKNKVFFDTNAALPTNGGKILQMMILSLNNILIPKTFYSSKLEMNYEDISSKLGNIFIMKGNMASKGENNFLIKTPEQFEEVKERMASIDESFIFQEYIPNDFDYRLVVLGNEVKAAEKRIRKNDDTHLNNASAGADEVFLDPNTLDKNLLDIAIKSANLFKREVAGVDLIQSKVDGSVYTLEVNPSPGFSIDDPTSNEVEELEKFLSSSAM